MSTSSTNPSRGQSAGAGLGNIVKGAFQTVQGLGDSIRGNAMDFVDSATGHQPYGSRDKRPADFFPADNGDLD
ncbi:hypothetical protein ONZ51_g13611 [Trametes cubensis]|uniref:Uncharacterized protein n=1 Tax=Trametes cubensis TaxID=1111947 RepID=A0AAD7TDX3_9APHY|nr:hypothetical protein ONZ51_g13611 [Trametes cubensis]